LKFRKLGHDKMRKRIYELDLLRGLGILLVVFFHSAWNICYEYGFTIIEGKWVICLVYFFAGMLIFVSGASSFLGHKTLKRGIMTFAFGMVVTGVTYFIYPDSYIKFGILHLLGVCMIMSWMIKKIKPTQNLIGIISAIMIIAGIIAGNITVKNKYIFWLGFLPENFSSLDYYPILPWMGVFFAGFVFSMLFYKDKESPFTKGIYKNNILTFSGRHSMLIYLVHQPIVYFLMFYTPIEKLLDKFFMNI